MDSFFRHEVTKHGYFHERFELNERDTLGFYFCRSSCGLVFSTTAIRNKYEEYFFQ
jgi:hypothetical protein